ncbi:putative CXXCH cytochrome family protein [Neobacillus niacini]|uniref:Ig-like domain-containing protein n=1 Tax=Neobacillus niacini TaxID=86668 RepID=UPI00278ADF3D|nr:Ig-like domain-containing protein [Neobacillus niacini]MDQ1000831.1 putative CXXCH cytochrome family protein [Neobacillus niacini]
MRIRVLLHKFQLLILIMLISFIQAPGSNTFLSLKAVQAVELDNTEPKVSVTSPVTGSTLNQEAVIISGTVENFATGILIALYNGSDLLGTISEVNENAWSISVQLSDGTYNVYAKAVDSESTAGTSNNVQFTLDTNLPTISFTTPKDEGYTNSAKIEGTSESNLTVKLCVDCMKNSEGQVMGDWISVLTDEYGKWSYEDTQIAEGIHTVYASVSDSAGNIVNKNITFTIDRTRPIVSPEFFPKQDVTQVSVDTTVKIRILDRTLINEQALKNSIILTQNGEAIPGEAVHNSNTNEVIFTPLEPLLKGKKYQVFISPLGLIDSAGNRAFPRFWSFTTESMFSAQHENPHGAYASNENTCVNCHSTHISSNPNLLKVNNTTETVDGKNSADDYCMACHDGTVVPMPENMESSHVHDAAVRIDGTPSGSGCASCHNPHLDWSEENPNLTQDHIVYEHQVPNEEIPTSSKEQLCESCHDSELYEKLSNPAVENRLFHYNKSSKSIGIYEDYNLCLRCHNQEFKNKYEGIPVIAGYYNNLTETTRKQYEQENGTLYSERDISKQEKSFSGHIIKAQDGSPLAGHLPCAECHDTHGSNNIKQLKTQIGHENPKPYNATTGDWDSIKERDFCIKCHNGETAVYGITGVLNKTVKGHEDGNKSACSSCHGGTGTVIEQARRAAHAPIKPVQ